ncbi:Uncharacterized protein FWK35_00031993, partial [Aphis craccivora]
MTKSISWQKNSSLLKKRRLLIIFNQFMFVKITIRKKLNIDFERSDECIDFTMMCVLDSERSEECIDFTMMC